MSENETRIGKAREILFTKTLTFEQKLKDLTQMGYDVSEHDGKRYIDNDSLLVLEDGRIFEIIEEKEYDYDDIAQASKNPDGTISYVLKYYNGGTCRDEMLVDAIEEMEKKL